MKLKKIYGLNKIEDLNLRKKVEKQAEEIGLIHDTDEVALIKNPNYIHPPFELYPLARKNENPLDELKGIIKDMDGTTTTTETLCIHSLEYMMRKATDRMDRNIWSGLDSKKDYPNIIGDSSTKHIEYLMKSYASDLKEEAFKKAFLEAVFWTLKEGKDEKRQEEASGKLSLMGLREFISEKEFDEKIFNKYSPKFSLQEFNKQVQAGLEVYYHRYHIIIGEIAAGRGENLRKELTKGKRLIEPMPGIEVYLALLKGWLGEELEVFFPEFKKYLLNHTHLNYSEREIEVSRPFMKAIGRYFQKNPVKIGIVTSSIKYEADIVLGEVFKIIREKIKNWPLGQEKKEKIFERFKDFREIYDSFITASDSSEIRLKPYHDLYSLALHQLGLQPNDYDKVLGFEDSESGLLAIRAAGVGKSIAVPFQDTHGHDLSSASHCLYGGIPEVLVVYHSFINSDQLEKFK